MEIIPLPISEEVYSYCNILKQIEDEMIRRFIFPNIILKDSRTVSTSQEVLTNLKYKEESDASTKS